MSWNRVPEPFNTVAARLTLLYAAFLACTLCTVFFALYYAIETHIEHDADRRLLERTKALSYYVHAADHDDIADEFTREADTRGIDRVLISVLDESGNTLISSDDSAWQNVDFADLPIGASHNRRSGLAFVMLPGRERARVLTERIVPGTLLRMAISIPEHERFLDDVRRTAGFALLAALVVSVPTGWFLARRAMSGVDAVTRMAARIADGNFSERVSASSSGAEISRLADTFNHMSERIETLIGAMRNLNDDVAHDLRSPLMRIRGMAEEALTARDERLDVRDLAGGVVEECDRLMVMISTMLDISEAEAGMGRLLLAETDAVEIVAKAAELFAPLAEERGVRIRCESASSCLLRCDIRKMQRAVANLIDNALKYTPPGGDVTVGAHLKGSLACIRVCDTGEGIAQDDIPRIFNRFHRGDRSRSRPGNGLGLCLVNAIVHAHGGDITVESSPGKGSCFTIRISRDP